MSNNPAYAKLIDDIKSMPLAHMIRHYAHLKSAGSGKYKACCPFHAEKTPSFHVDEARGRWHCFGGCGEGGTIIDFVMKIENCDFRAAVTTCAAHYGLAKNGDHAPVPKPVRLPLPRETSEEQLERVARERLRAHDIWCAGIAPEKTVVETYLRETRGIPLQLLPGGCIPFSIRYAPSMKLWHSVAGKMVVIAKTAAMISPIQRADGSILGVHITYLDPATADKIRIADPCADGRVIPAKKVRGSAWGGCMRFGLAQAKMNVAEGCETALSVMALTGVVTWGCGSIGNLAGHGVGVGEIHPRRADLRLPSVYPDMTGDDLAFPELVDDLTIWQDNDAKDPEHAAALYERAARRHAVRIDGARRRIGFKIPDAGMDWNDMLRAAGSGKAGHEGK